MKQKTETFLANKAAWKRAIAPYQQPDLRRSVWQMVNTLVPYFTLWVLMVMAYRVSYWLALPLIVLAAGFLIRTFIIFHDCGHGAFFENRRANEIVGFLTGVLVATPYFSWRHAHALHHASSGDLDRRGDGDIWMMTVDEYVAASRWKRLGYRLYRSPLVLFGIGPAFQFMLSERWPKYGRKRERRSVLITDVVLLLLGILMSLLIGFKTFIVLQGSVLWLAAIGGVWLFYVQHQYEGMYWQRHEEWSYALAAVEGSSFYKLPKVLQWFTGNIGFHHIHHLSPRIPNYNLEACYNAIPELQTEPVTLRQSIKCIRYRLWDEANYRLISWREFRQLMQQRAAAPA
ncbi:MAG: fatty acid desaturase [Anaerolineales bacterium]|nr:fatty acid desaturase [Anaerolineales bacterium]